MIPNAATLITHATTPWGRTFAERLLHRGQHLVLVDQEAEALMLMAASLQEHLPSGMVTTIVKNTSHEAAAVELYDELRLRQLFIDTCISTTAPVSTPSLLTADMPETTNTVMRSILYTTQLTRLLLRDMLHRQQGRMLHMATLAGTMPGLLQSLEGATQSYMIYLTEALQYELRNSQVTLTLMMTPTTDGYTSDLYPLVDTALAALQQGKRRVAVPGEPIAMPLRWHDNLAYTNLPADHVAP